MSQLIQVQKEVDQKQLLETTVCYDFLTYCHDCKIGNNVIIANNVPLGACYD